VSQGESISVELIYIYYLFYNFKGKEAGFEGGRAKSCKEVSSSRRYLHNFS
jgi:hypothetical protein